MENHSSKWCCFSLPTDVSDQELLRADRLHLPIHHVEDPVQRLNGTPLHVCWYPLFLGISDCHNNQQKSPFHKKNS